MSPFRSHLVGFLLLSAVFLSGQTKPLVSYSCAHKPLSEVVPEWEKLFDLAFAYESGLIEDQFISIDLRGVPLDEALDRLFIHTTIQSEMVSTRYIVLSPRPGPPEPYRLCGRLLDADTREPLIYANIHVVGTTTGTNSSENGHFELAVPPGLGATIAISYLGYESLEIDLFQLLARPCRELLLKVDAQVMPEIIVQDFTVDMLELNESPQVITFKPKKIPTLPGWGEPDVLRSLQMIPGISSADESASRLHIRGGSSDQNLILWDGIPIYHAGHFFGLYSAFNPYVVDEMEVYRGDFGVEYGDRLSGVIDISGKPERVEKPHFGLGWNLINAHGFAEIPLMKNKASLLLAARRSYTDLIQSTTYQNLLSKVFVKGRLSNNLEDRDEDQENILAEPSFYYADLNGKFAWDISAQDYLSISTYWGLDQFDYEFSVYESYSTRDQLNLANQGASVQYTRTWNEKNHTEAQATYSRFTNDYDLYVNINEQRDSAVFEAGHSNYLRDWGAKIMHTWQPSARHQWMTGFQYSYKIADYRYQEREGGKTNEFGAEATHAVTNSWFGSYQYNIQDRWFFQVGLRRDGYTARFNGEDLVRYEAAWQPRLKVQWNPNSGPWTWHTAFGFYKQFMYQIPADFTDLGSGEKLWVVADDFFPSLSGGQLSIGGQYGKGQQVLDITAYAKAIGNMSSWNLNLEDNQETPLTFDGVLLANGLDILWKNRWGRYGTWLGYSLGMVQNRFPSILGNEFFPVDYDHRHQLNSTHTWTLEKWEFSLNWVFKSGKPYTEPLGIDAFENNEGEIEIQYRYGQPNNQRLPTYQRLDLAINYKFSNDWWSGKLGFSIFNFFNRANLLDIDYVIFGPNLYAQQYYPESVALQRDMLAVTPNLFIQLEW